MGVVVLQREGVVLEVCCLISLNGFGVHREYRRSANDHRTSDTTTLAVAVHPEDRADPRNRETQMPTISSRVEYIPVTKYTIEAVAPMGANDSKIHSFPLRHVEPI